LEIIDDIMVFTAGTSIPAAAWAASGLTGTPRATLEDCSVEELRALADCKARSAYGQTFAQYAREVMGWLERRAGGVA